MIQIQNVYPSCVQNLSKFTKPTLSFRPNDSVQISLAGKTIDVRTHVFKQRGKKYLGSAYPDL